MGRLVDTDEIKKMFDPETWQGEMMIAITDTIPTAYDPDKVAEQLEAASYRTESTFDEDGYSNDDSDEVILLDKAIEIVKAGGVDE